MTPHIYLTCHARCDGRTGSNFDLSNASIFLSRRALQPSAQSGLPLWQDYIFIPMARSASDVSDQFCIPEDQAVEVGARITI
jgi:KUP system potassium uptake protein